MSFFAKLMGGAKAQINTYSGNRDFLEAVAAATALVAAADGSIEDEEIVAAVEAVSHNATLSSVYSPAEIEDEITKQLRKAKTASGRVQLKRELQDVATKEKQLREDVFLTAVDVATADGEIAPAEQKALDGIAQILGVNAQQLLAA